METVCDRAARPGRATAIDTEKSDDRMPDWQLLQSSRSPDDRKKKRKRRKKAPTSSTESRIRPQGVSSLPETLRASPLPPEHLGDNTASRRKDGEHVSARAPKGKKHPKGSQLLLTLTSQTGGGGGPAQGSADDVSVQTRDSLRWEGALEDPQAEEKRLELYRANRRQRYISHRERLC